MAPEITRLHDDDLSRFNEGLHFRLYNTLGSHLCSVEGTAGTYFAVWAPQARQVSVVGDFNNWEPNQHALQLRDTSGIWEGFVAGVAQGALYKYLITLPEGDEHVYKADPFAFYHESPPDTASVVWDLTYAWGDQQWMAKRSRHQSLKAPIAIYEVHLGSWRRMADSRSFTYRELAAELTAYVQEMNFTHVEFLPVMEHPFYGSWGYQITGYFAPTSRYGTPQDFMCLIDYLHQHGIGVILDWVPSHFPDDEHGLGRFDGTPLYEHPDPRRGVHPDWDSLIFDYGRPEVQSFLISNAQFWLEHYHVDGLRVDGVASMLYLNYSRGEGEWLPNRYGGTDNLEAIALLRRLNDELKTAYPDVLTIAEESTAWSMVTGATSNDGLGFDLKWDLGWMHDTLGYLARDPLFRKYDHNALRFRPMYAFSEHYVLPLSHDEVVHGKGSLFGKMPDDDDLKLPHLRLLFGYMYAQPGKKLLFMGNELGQQLEWNHDASLDWSRLKDEGHAGLQKWIADLNRLYRMEPGLHELDCEQAGFSWINHDDADHSVFSFTRQGTRSSTMVLVVCNFTPVTRFNYRVGVPQSGYWRELLNSAAAIYAGRNEGNMGSVEASPVACDDQPYSIELTLPPLGVLFLKHGRP